MWNGTFIEASDLSINNLNVDFTVEKLITIVLWRQKDLTIIKLKTKCVSNTLYIYGLSNTVTKHIRNFTSLNLERRNVGGKTIILIYKMEGRQ